MGGLRSGAGGLLGLGGTSGGVGGLQRRQQNQLAFWRLLGRLFGGGGAVLGFVSAAVSLDAADDEAGRSRRCSGRRVDHRRAVL